MESMQRLAGWPAERLLAPPGPLLDTKKLTKKVLVIGQSNCSIIFQLFDFLNKQVIKCSSQKYS